LQDFPEPALLRLRDLHCGGQAIDLELQRLRLAFTLASFLFNVLDGQILGNGADDNRIERVGEAVFRDDEDLSGEFSTLIHLDLSGVKLPPVIEEKAVHPHVAAVRSTRRTFDDAAFAERTARRQMPRLGNTVHGSEFGR